MKFNEANVLLEAHMRELGLQYRVEFAFHSKRKWRFDYVLVNIKGTSTTLTHPMIAIEIEGGTWIQGRHSRPMGMQGDVDKYNEAARLGWYVIRFTTQDVLTGKAREFLRSWLCAKEK
jgi:hypothetical protein